ncbi:hypothetical protein GWI33_014172 [Rhynchophorus ferrugineus]|uniref:Mos1 transposase HTH domain-containing protein n=1 Tax=Rhynchophorus ferrugineus TaxID=354439 RepID=A0A834M9D1_RHYFE|nr:hypothetical protein GWI33_014172 [Rhynchophorus ferrugineus]
MDKKEFRVLIKYCFLKGKNTFETKILLDIEISNTPPEKSSIKDWYAKFRCGEMSTEDDTLKIQTECVHHIIYEYLGMGKLCAKWVPRELTFDQNQRRVDDSEQCLKMIERNKLDIGFDNSEKNILK